MPDQADVEAALAAAVAGALYPQGAAEASAAGIDCRAYRGWPTAAALEADLAAGVAHVSVQPMAAGFRDTTRYLGEWQGTPPPVTLTATVDGETVTFAGDPAAGQVAGVRVDGLPRAYRRAPGRHAGRGGGGAGGAGAHRAPGGTARRRHPAAGGAWGSRRGWWQTAWAARSFGGSAPGSG
jgi:hypothetical protein